MPRTVRVGLVREHGGFESYFGIIDDPALEDSWSEAQDVELTAQQEKCARAAIEKLKTAWTRANELKTESGRAKRRDAVYAAYTEKIQWLHDLYGAARDKADAEEIAAYKAELKRQAEVEEVRLAKEDAELGPRSFALTTKPGRRRTPAIAHHSRSTSLKQDEEVSVLHRTGCRLIKHSAELLRIDAALDHYADGAVVCKVCRVEDHLAEAPGFLAKREVRESAPTPFTAKQLEKLVGEIDRWWAYPWGLHVGFGLVAFHHSEDDLRQVLGLTPDEGVIGWNDRKGYYNDGIERKAGLLPIPDEERARLVEHLANKGDWAVRELSGHGFEGYLAVRKLTLAELRKIKETK